MLGDYLSELANKHRWVLVAVDTMGLSRHDLLLLLRLAVNQPWLTYEMTDMVMQSHVNRLIAEKVSNMHTIKVYKCTYTMPHSCTITRIFFLTLFLRSSWTI